MAKTAFLFPGQGSQTPGMMSDLANEFSIVRETFDSASAVLGYDLWSMISDNPENTLNSTEITQPAMLVSGIASWRVWRHLGGARPDYFAGHSLGEYTALVATGVIEFTDAVSIVAARGRLMQQLTPVGTGSMVAVHGLDDELVRGICAQVENGEIVACSNYNAPGHVVISGNCEAVGLATEIALEAGATRIQPLPVSVPCHCLLMKPAAIQLQNELLSVHFSDSSIPVIQNADVRAYHDAEQVREALARQLWQPVRWTETIASLLDSGVTYFAECGPGNKLAELNRQISEETAVFALTGQDIMNEFIQLEESNES